MNWLTNFIRPKIQSIVGPKDVPDNLWQKCPSCSGMLFHRDLAENMNVCSHCGHHLKMPVKDRLELLFDNGVYKRIEVPNVPSDPLKFKDKKKYVDRLKDAQSKTGEKDAIIVAEGEVGGMPTVIAAFNFDFMGGSMGAAVGEGIVRAAETAVARNAALIAIPASGGARMQEGMVSLIQLPRSVIAVRMVKDAGLPYIVLLTDPTTGGVSASFAMLGDIHMAEPGCMIGFAGKRVIEETIREQLPSGFQTAEYLRDHGMVDMVVPRKELKETMARILNLLMNRTGSSSLGGNTPKIGQGKNMPAKSGLFSGKTAFAPHATLNQANPANDPSLDSVKEPARVLKK
jgi:acetyl-CoA carboxylase carboxyl transferase subunit beta